MIIAGGGICGLATALTLHQIGVPFRVFAAVPELRPLGVGINLQPNAMRELFDMGIDAPALDTVGVPAREWAMVGRNGHDIYAEPRGESAGYRWPQIAVHRRPPGPLPYAAGEAAPGADAIRLGHQVTGYENNPGGTVMVRIDRADGATLSETGSLLIAADGIHSAVRQQMHPGQPPIHWGGKLMWRGTTQAMPIRTGSSFIGLGTHRQRMVIYPISHPDPATGLATINWIAEVTVDPSAGWQKTGWFAPVEIDSFAHYFAD